jgi:hypothetical protein
MRLGPAQLVVGHVCVHDHLVMFEQPQTVTTTPTSVHELDTHSIDTVTVAGHRMSYHEYVPGAYYGLKDRAPQKRYLVLVLGLHLLLNRQSESSVLCAVRHTIVSSCRASGINICVLSRRTGSSELLVVKALLQAQVHQPARRMSGE